MGLNKLSDVWKINGVPIYEPSNSVGAREYESLSASGSGRDDTGTMHPGFIALAIPKVSYKLRAATGEEVAFILSLVQGKTFELTYPEPMLGKVITAQFYCGKSSATPYSSALYSDEGGLYVDVQFNMEAIHKLR